MYAQSRDYQPFINTVSDNTTPTERLELANVPVSWCIVPRYLNAVKNTIVADSRSPAGIGMRVGKPTKTESDRVSD